MWKQAGPASSASSISAVSVESMPRMESERVKKLIDDWTPSSVNITYGSAIWPNSGSDDARSVFGSDSADNGPSVDSESTICDAASIVISDAPILQHQMGTKCAVAGFVFIVPQTKVSEAGGPCRFLVLSLFVSSSRSVRKEYSC